MTVRTLSFQIEEAAGGYNHSFTADGDDVTPEEVALLLVAAAQRILHQSIFDETEAQDPLGNEEFHKATSALEARVLLMDLVCHLPDVNPDGTISAIAGE